MCLAGSITAAPGAVWQGRLKPELSDAQVIPTDHSGA